MKAEQRQADDTVDMLVVELEKQRAEQAMQITMLLRAQRLYRWHISFACTIGALVGSLVGFTVTRLLT